MPLKSTWRCPSNIALVKYWGKKEGGVQLPANPSISLTLSDLYAQTSITLVHGNVSGQPAFSFLLDGQRKPGFEPKILAFLQRIWNDLQVVREYHLHIESVNNFPHGTGIASSAAGFGALALCICDLEEQITGVKFENLQQKASELARLGSGSACRSLFSGAAVWGETPVVQGASDLYAVPFDKPIAEPLNDLMDAVLIVDDEEKQVSSTQGHALLKGNVYAPARYAAAQENMQRISDALNKGSIRSFIAIVESEALQLHAMMMASSQYYILMRPNTLAIIEKIWKFRENTGLPVMFTLDAGANVHLLFPKMYNAEVVNFIETDLLAYCKNRQYLCSSTGNGPEKQNE
ncbi:MAG: diphosphomevalonate decarboxylase [Bacteroidia bacterium]|nr:diphosphomevalonate decarboxylase [Bacteroidia bacterium]